MAITGTSPEEEEGQTYGIKGIPPPANAESKTKTIPFAPGMPVRHELSSVYPPKDPKMKKQWTLFILALEQFKAMPVEKKLSYFQVAGIHGYPETSWDGAGDPPKDPADPGPGDDPYGGYCRHNTILFPTWHRPYVLLYEQLIWTHMCKLIKSWRLDDSQTAEWQEAADSWRLPYWDWARKSPSTEAGDSSSFSLPVVFCIEKVKIYRPSGEADYENPLWGFVNPEKLHNKPRKFCDMPEGKKKWNIKNHNDPKQPENDMPWGECSGVSRYGVKRLPDGNYSGLEGLNEWKVVNKTLNDTVENWINPFPNENDKFPYSERPSTLADAVSRMFSPDYNSTWGSFASTKWFQESESTLSTGYLSLEYIHNNIHVFCGGDNYDETKPPFGVGQMADVPVAAFDPLFWMHHCNIDRLLAMWQVINWQAWWDTLEPKHSKPNQPNPTPHDPLVPFHNVSNGDPDKDYWTSDLARDWTKLHYQYDNLVPQPGAILPDGTLNEEEYKYDVLSYIYKTYPCTPHYIGNVANNQTTHDNNKIFGPVHTKNQTWNDYLINVVYDRYALNGRSYTIEFWLGGEPGDPKSAFKQQKNLIGRVYNFGGLIPATTGSATAVSASGCTNCGSQKGHKILSKAQVPLTIQILSQALDGKNYPNIHSTTTDEVNKYLEKHLHWRYVQIGGREMPSASFPHTKISVWRGIGQPSEHSSTQRKLPPKYGGYIPIHAATHDKEGGLRCNDEVLGEHKLDQCKFRQAFGA